MIKQMICSLWMSLLMIFGFSSSPLVGRGREIVTDTQRVVAMSRPAYLKYVSKVHDQVNLARNVGNVPFFGKAALGIGAALGGHTTKDLENAKITWRFFNSGRSIATARDIGSSADLAYIASVYTEFFSNSSHTFEHLVMIMHHKMMDALGLPASTSIGQFRKYIEQTNKKGRYMYVNGTQFDTYARLIALNLFITYWYDTHIV